MTETSDTGPTTIKIPGIGTYLRSILSDVLKMKARSRGRIIDQRKLVLGVEIIESIEPLQ
ncbi:hypothetical protein CY34DRAFT_480686 [Suillus luteus UH-Slu-Lm8-n1]|uniref:Uncharacterized protein n=1 Tax=Suillus luteus UH-Slu-Lm8-n1 TaxID=930992 RepID=A0A0D0B7P5_9AGAM|nr:hypothetical protein CY34DRAFT_480686 [Suillus luteus UH-Slu-Lm8-n1]